MDSTRCWAVRGQRERELQREREGEWEWEREVGHNIHIQREREGHHMRMVAVLCRAWWCLLLVPRDGCATGREREKGEGEGEGEGKGARAWKVWEAACRKGYVVLWI